MPSRETSPVFAGRDAELALLERALDVRQTPVLLIVTFRSDDADRAPLRSLTAGLGRMEGVWRIELERLSRRYVAAQLAGILGGPPQPALINAVCQRGGGNPLFTEALVNPDGSLVTELPWSLRDLILAAVKELPAKTQQVLRVTAVGGIHVGHALLAAAARLDDAALTSALRPAVTAHILIGDADGYAFRHQLFREAVLADLLPGERTAARAAAVPRLTPLHDAYATVFAAEAARADRRQDQAGWDAAHAAWERLGQPYPAAYAMLHAARAALAAAHREEAAARLRVAAERAEQVGAEPLQQQITRLARQARVDLPASSRAAAPVRFGLTEREVEVLRLVATGRANRDIAAELFISPKTASVHVSNILAKLGVATRTEAAAVTHRMHLLDEL
jgi:DNA-binding CsgD family transcriptional regulator